LISAGCTILEVSDSPFVEAVSALFVNSVACNLIASRGESSDQTPSSGRACGIFRSDRSRRFFGSLQLPWKCVVREVKEGSERRNVQRIAFLSQSKVQTMSQIVTLPATQSLAVEALARNEKEQWSVVRGWKRIA
jgi:hypothetical protein